MRNIIILDKKKTWELLAKYSGDTTTKQGFIEKLEFQLALLGLPSKKYLVIQKVDQVLVQ